MSNTWKHPPRRVTWQRRMMRGLNQAASAILLALIAAFVIGQALKWWLA